MKTFPPTPRTPPRVATVFALLRGITQSLKTSHEDLTGPGPNMSGHRQNKAMQMRIFFQAIAILIIVLLLMLGSGKN